MVDINPGLPVFLTREVETSVYLKIVRRSADITLEPNTGNKKGHRRRETVTLRGISPIVQ